MAVDFLAGASWTCTATEPGRGRGPADLDALATEWWPATVPGTAAGALRAAGRWSPGSEHDFDATDWWFRTRFAGRVGAVAGRALLCLGGLATVADVWLNDDLVRHSENMFLAHDLEVDLQDDNELAIRCAALGPLLAVARPRPRWKAGIVGQQNLRWYRTSLRGRMSGGPAGPPAVGPWRAITLETVPPVRVVQRRLAARCDAGDGLVEVDLRLRGNGAGAGPAVLRCGGAEVRLDARPEGDDLGVTGAVRVPDVRRWWPHTHGAQARYDLSLSIGGHVVDLGRVGFRTVEADRTDGGFTLAVNGEAVFCRGACWVPPDPVGLAASPEQVRASLALVRAGNLNMVRITGTTAYEDGAFWDACDELGILVWQDCMFANMDFPDDEAFVAGVEEEVAQVLTGLQGRPSAAVVSGGSEIEQQAAMLGLSPGRYALPLIGTTIAYLASRLLPGVAYVTNSPSGDGHSFQVDTGVAHYFGVGAYLRSLDDARRSGVRFAAECLAFAVPPERVTVEECFGGATGAGHRPEWKRAVPRDATASWDFEDVRDHYVRALFGADPAQVRRVDPERALDLGRAAVAELVAAVMQEWRRPGSSCAGGLVLDWQDTWPGAGWGLVDALGRPKAPWFTLRRACRPLALFVVDEGLNGLRLHLVNDTAREFRGTVRVELYSEGDRRAGRAEDAVRVAARSGLEISADAMFEGFRDLGYSYRFGPPPHDVVVASLVDDDGVVVSVHAHLPLGPGRAVEPEVGLEARAVAGADGSWTAAVSTRRFAQFVAFDVAGFRPADSWFHLAPGGSCTVDLHPDGTQDRPTGEVRALNSTATAPLVTTG